VFVGSFQRDGDCQSRRGSPTTDSQSAAESVIIPAVRQWSAALRRRTVQLLITGWFGTLIVKAAKRNSRKDNRVNENSGYAIIETNSFFRV